MALIIRLADHSLITNRHRGFIAFAPVSYFLDT